MTTPDPTANPTLRLLDDFSLEITGKEKDVDSLRAAAADLPAGTRVNVTFLGNEDLEMRVNASKAVLALGLTPVPHVSARRLRSEAELREFLAALQEIGASKHLFSVGGDPETPMGPYTSSLDVIRTGLLPEYGVEEVSIAGYPEGHPDIPNDVLWRELEGKAQSLREQGLGTVLLTQFGFDVDPVIAWIRDVRARGVEGTIRIGTPGPAGVKRLIGFARRFGIGANAMIVKKYGFSLTNLMGTAGPDRFVTDLANLVAAEPDAGDIGLHFYTFGGTEATTQWTREFAARQAAR